ncbi:MAG: hypothetical protein Q4E53_03490 [Eubacteriales bacterium]|nr:hypothetical protein [Eubacteriales bacterium]
MEINYEKGLIASFGNHEYGLLMEKVLKAGFQDADLEYIYHNVVIEKEKLEEALAGVRLFGMHGFDLSDELQEEVLPYLDEISPSARICGRVNVVVNREGELVGENSAAKGLVTALLARDILPKGHTFAVVGEEDLLFVAAVELAISGADRIYLCNNQEEKSREWIEKLENECDTDFICRRIVPEDVNVIIGYDMDQDMIDQYEMNKKLLAICDMKLELPMEMDGREINKKIHKENLYYIEEKEILFYMIRLHFNLWTEYFGSMDIMWEAMEEELLKMAGLSEKEDSGSMMELPELSYVQERICRYAMEQYGEAVKNYCHMVHGNISEMMMEQDLFKEMEEEELQILEIMAYFLPLLRFRYEIEAREESEEEKEESLVHMICDILEDPDLMSDLADRILYLLIHFMPEYEKAEPLLSFLRQIAKNVL